MIDLSQLPAPEIIETIDFETILAERKAELVALYPADEQAAVAAVLELESEPITKLLQACAYREVTLRQRINEAAMAVMLAYARGGDLDQIGANNEVERLVIDEGDADAVPPVDPTYEYDDDYRYRIQLSRDGYSTAGSIDSYIYWALSADGQVKDAQPVSPTPGAVTVYVLSRSGDGSADELLLDKVVASVNADSIRPMTDNVTVQSAAIVNYTIDASLEIYLGPDQLVVQQAAIDAVTTYAEAQRRIGYDVTLSGLYAALHQSGVKRVNLIAPAADVIIGDGQASYCTGITVSIAEGAGV